MKELKVIQDKLNAILKEGQATVEKFTKEVEIANLAEKQASRDYIKAKEEVNVEAFTKASQDKRTSKDIAELYHSKIDEVISEPFISEQEYKTYKNEIVKVMKKSNQQATKKIDTIINQLQEVREELGEDLALTNALLKTLQIDIYKQPERYNYYSNREKRELTTMRVDDKYKYEDTILCKTDIALRALKIKDVGGHNNE